MNPLSKDTPEFSVGQDPRPPIRWWQGLLFAATLRPYGNDLLTRSARGNLLIVSLVMLLLAIAEGTAWGYLGSTFIPDYPVAGWLILGSFVFLLMWFFDRALVTTDVLEAEHRQTLVGQTLDSKPKGFWANIGPWLQDNPAWIFRIGIAVLSLVIAAPYVTEIVFKADIQNKQREYVIEQVKQAKANYSQQSAVVLKQLADNIAVKNNELQAEISGGKNSKSGVYGKGDTAIAIEEERDDLKAQYLSLDTERKDRLKRIENAIKNNHLQDLAALDIRVDQDSPVLRKKAIKDIEASHPDEFFKIEWTARALLIILAAALFGLKLMQPRVVKLYYSARLQELWNLYCLGKFDIELAADEGRAMLLNSRDALPEEFERIMLRYQQDHAQHELRQREQVKQMYLKREQAEAKQQAAEYAAEQQREQLRLADDAHHARLAKEKADTERRERDQVFLMDQMAHALDQINDEEQRYLDSHQRDIDVLTAQEQRLNDEAHELEKNYKTHVERCDARRQRIHDAEDELQQTEQHLHQIRQRDDSDRLQVLRTIEDLEMASIRQRERIGNQKAELMGFVLQQKCYEENRQVLQTQLAQTRERLARLKAPLDTIKDARLSVETRRIELACQQGHLDSPYAVHDVNEMPFLVEKLRQQLRTSGASLSNQYATSLS